MPERFAGKAYLHEEADAEFVEASHRYDVESDEVAAAFEAEVERAVAFIVEFYVVDTDRIRILAVAHHKRRPGYWTGRR